MDFFTKRAERFISNEFSTRPSTPPAEKRLTDFVEIPLEMIVTDPQTRTHFDQDSLNALAGSLKTAGLLQPLRVRFCPERKRYVVVCGGGRFRAAQIAGLTAVACQVIDESTSEHETLLQRIQENDLRESLRPSERAAAFKLLMDRKGWSCAQVADATNVSAMTISRHLAVLRMPNELRAAVDGGEIGLVAAIKRLKQTEKVGETKRRQRRAGRVVKIKTDTAAVTIKARRVLSSDAIVSVLQAAIEKLQRTAAAA